MDTLQLCGFENSIQRGMLIRKLTSIATVTVIIVSNKSFKVKTELLGAK